MFAKSVIKKSIVFSSPGSAVRLCVTKNPILALCGAVGAVSSGCETPMEIVFRSHFKVAKSKRGTGVNKAAT